MMQTDPNTLTDNDLIHRILAGEVDAFEPLLLKYKASVTEVVKRHVPYPQVAAIVHEVFIRAYQSLPGYKSQSSFAHWLSVIAVRTCYDFWRQQYRARELPMSSLSEHHQQWLENVITDHSQQSVEAHGRSKEAREVLEWALERLSPEDRMVLELVYLEGCSIKEAATLLGWSVANVKIRAFRSRKKLYKLLTDLLEA